MRVLIAGTKVDASIWREFISEQAQVIEGRPIREYFQPRYSHPEQILAVHDKVIASLPNGQETSVPLVYCTNGDTFWSNFFSSRHFLDDVLPTVPMLIIASGELRFEAPNGAMSSIDVRERLLVIAQHLNVPLVFGMPGQLTLQLSDEDKNTVKRLLSPHFK